MPIAEHMIDRYGTLWPGHPLRFRLPDGPRARAVADLHPGSVETVPTPDGNGTGRIRDAVLGLLSGIEDEQWVYWCIDDKYPVRLDAAAMDRLVDAIERIDDPGVSGLLPVRPRQRVDRARHDPDDRLRVESTWFLRRHGWGRIWLHQFVRAGLLRSLMEPMPEVIPAAKAMDGMIKVRALPAGRTVWTIERGIAVLGESTTAGALTRNCAKSMRERGPLPAGYDVSTRAELYGGGRAAHAFRRLRAALPQR